MSTPRVRADRTEWIHSLTASIGYALSNRDCEDLLRDIHLLAKEYIASLELIDPDERYTDLESAVREQQTLLSETQRTLARAQRELARVPRRHGCIVRRDI